jgi:hypothetical protein
MKTLLFKHNKLQLLRKCESTFTNLFFLLWQLPQHGVSSGLAQTIRLWMMTAHVHKVALAGLRALMMSATSNHRIYGGLVLMGVVSPLAACVYLVFDRTSVVNDWYHLNYFHLFFLIGPHLFQFFCLVGAFLLFPQGSKRAYLLAVPIGFVLAKIIWLILVTNNAEFWQVVPSSFVLIGILISGVLLLTIDFLTWRQFHGLDSFEKREKGLYQIADDVTPEKFKSMVMETWRNKFEFHSKY